MVIFLVAAGKPGMWGAAALVCLAGYRMGAGYVTCWRHLIKSQAYSFWVAS